MRLRPCKIQQFRVRSNISARAISSFSGTLRGILKTPTQPEPQRGTSKETEAGTEKRQGGKTLRNLSSRNVLNDDRDGK